jgi:hypothetical protein
MSDYICVANYPYQNAKVKKDDGTTKKGKGGNNMLYAEMALADSKLYSTLNTIYPPAALLKSTVRGKHTKLMQHFLDTGAFTYIDLDAEKSFNVGTAICASLWQKGQKSTHTKIISDGVEHSIPNEELWYIPPHFNAIEHSVFQKMYKNRNGKPIKVNRDGDGMEDKLGDVKNDFWFARFGYPYISVGRKNNKQALSCSNEWIASDLGLWLLWYTRQHEQMMYHLLLSGFYDGPIDLSEEEVSMIESRRPLFEKNAMMGDE